MSSHVQTGARHLIFDPSRTVLIAMVAVACLMSPLASASMDDIAGSGWFTWRVEAAQSDHEWCCFSWSAGNKQSGNCDLDSSHVSYGRNEKAESGSGQMQFYARLQNGNVTKLWTLSPQCRVINESGTTDLGLLDVPQSIHWLATLVVPHSPISSDAIAALSVHSGRLAITTLLDFARDDADIENRKDAVFWLAQVRGLEAGQKIIELMFADSDPEFREHVAFSVSQSNAAGKNAALVRLGRQDADAEVRGKAWFWLAQTGDASVEQDLLSVLQDEQDNDVREEAIFALAQLPDERAVAALVKVVENRQLTDDERKKALFWLANLESDSALEYVAGLLVDH